MLPAKSPRSVVRFHAATVALLLFAPVAIANAQTDTEVVTNETVVHMVTGKLSKDLIVGKITAAVPGFDLSSEGLVLLNTNKVDANIVKAMFDAAESAKRRGVANSVTGFDEVLTNEIMIRMVSAKVSKDLIMRKMQMSRSQFDVSSAGMVNLNQNKVPQDIIKAMMLPPRAPEAAASTIPVRPPVGKPTEPTKTPAKAPAKTPPPPAKKPPQH
ncbi:MAG: hypothetical protein ABJB74_01645 [Gemmatimonas sp.]